MSQGFRHVEGEREPPDYVLFTDADISYEAPDARASGWCAARRRAAWC